MTCTKGLIHTRLMYSDIEASVVSTVEEAVVACKHVFRVGGLETNMACGFRDQYKLRQYIFPFKRSPSWALKGIRAV